MNLTPDERRFIAEQLAERKRQIRRERERKARLYSDRRSYHTPSEDETRISDLVHKILGEDA